MPTRMLQATTALALLSALSVGPLAAQARPAQPPPRPVIAITKVTATVSQPSSKKCPTKLTFTGSITANLPGASVRYEWIRSDGVRSAAATHTMSAVTWSPTYVWTTGSTINTANPEVSASLHVLAPNDMTSAPAKTANHCK